MKSQRAILVAGAFALAAPAVTNAATAASEVTAPRAGAFDVTDQSAHRPASRYRHHHGHARSQIQPYYYDRPVYYRPYPYASPAPFIFGFGFEPAR